MTVGETERFVDVIVRIRGRQFPELRCARLRFVHTVPEENLVTVPLRDLRKPAVEAPHQFRRCFGKPCRSEIVPAERVPFRRDAVAAAEIKDVVGWRTTVDRNASGFKTQFAVFRFQIGPVERNDRFIEQGSERFFVLAVLLLFRELAEHERIAAEQEFMRFLFQSDSRISDRFSVRSFQIELSESLAVHFGSLPDTEFHFRIFPEQVFCEFACEFVHVVIPYLMSCSATRSSVRCRVSIRSCVARIAGM